MVPARQGALLVDLVTIEGDGRQLVASDVCPGDLEGRTDDSFGKDLLEGELMGPVEAELSDPAPRSDPVSFPCLQEGFNESTDNATASLACG